MRAKSPKLQPAILQGDCAEILKDFPDDHFDLIITSPPYADRRAHTYGGIKPEDYSDWFLWRSCQFMRVLKPTGTFVLNIKEQVDNGERHTYVLELILSLRKQGWLWTEEFIWHKSACMPGKWPNRFRDAWERCLQFNKQRKFNMYQEAVMLPRSANFANRVNRVTDKEKVRRESGTKSGFGINVSNMVNLFKVYPTNVLYLSSESKNQKHSAAFPKALPDFFIKLFTKKGNLVLDPFVGSGTTCQVAQKLGRQSVGIDILKENCELAIRKTTFV